MPRPIDSESISALKAILRWGKWVVLIVGIVLVIAFFKDFTYTVEQNEVAGVTRNGALNSDKPIGPGLHFKLPFIDSVHEIKTSLDRLPIDKLTVKTTDNQFVEIDLNLTYRVADPFKALFAVGDMGHGSIVDKVIPFVQSRTLDVFGQVNALQIVDQKKKLEGDILLAVQAPAMDFFGERIEDVQITGIRYSEGFERNIEKMVQTRNEQISAQNMLKVNQIDAERAVAQAKGLADAEVTRAEGQKRVAIEQAEGAASQVRLAAEAQAYAQTVNASANAKATELMGAAQGSQLAALVKAAGTPEQYAAILTAQAARNWSGGVPQYQLVSSDKGSGILPILNLNQPQPAK